MKRDEKLYQAKSTSLIYFFKVFLSSVKQTKFKIVENVAVTYGRYMYFNQKKEHHIHLKIFVHVFT